MKTTNINKFNNLPQRQKKYAKTKIALLNVLLNELEKKSISEIMIKDLVKYAEVSEPTFFNYFDSKLDMLVYFIQLWSIEMNALAQRSELESNSYVKTIKDIFKQSSVQIIKNPQLMLEIIAFQTQGLKTNPHSITKAEKWLFFPEITEVENIEGMGLESILPPLITKAIQSKELDKSTNAQLLFLTLSSLFFGTALLVLKDSPQAYPSLLEEQLNQLFKGLSC
jgi:AcrR family transcriptional regulator